MKVIKKILRFICSIPVYIYKAVISPLIPHTCRFYPTCSSYAIEAVYKFGFFKGISLTSKRLVRCNPKNKECGYDPVPNNIKGEIKWLI